MVPKIYKKVGQRIRELRKAAQLSQEQLARKLGHTQGYIAQVEQGVRKIDLAGLTRLADTFNVPVDYFLKGGWRVRRHKGQAAIIIDGLDLQTAFDQYLAETAFESLRSTEEVRLKALAVPEQCAAAMAEFADNERIYYSYAPTPTEWHWLENRIARRGGAYRSIADVIHTLETLRHSGVLEKK